MHAFSVVLGIGQDITLLRLGLTVIYSEIKTTLYTLSKAHSETGRVTSGFAGPGPPFVGRMVSSASSTSRLSTTTVVVAYLYK